MPRWVRQRCQLAFIVERTKNSVYIILGGPAMWGQVNNAVIIIIKQKKKYVKKAEVEKKKNN